MRQINKDVRVVEVGPRDGFQNVKAFIPTEKKIEMIETVIDAGVKEMEITSFVSPKAIPQMADAKEVVGAIKARQHKDLFLTALVPNLFGARVALEMKMDAINFVISVSESHNKENVRHTIDESFAELEKIVNEYSNVQGAPHLILSLPTTFGCPFEGPQPVSKVINMVRRGMDLGIRRFIFSDTIGVANPLQVESFFEEIFATLPSGLELGLHLHDTRGMALANAFAALSFPINSLESSFGGFGGCPFAPGAAGNVATEDLVNMLENLGVPTGIDIKKLVKAALELAKFAPDALNSHMARVLTGKAAPCGL
ncbi:MAG TPA: hydroxymethylglutaryl-CoA lyase [Acetomicrobium flavidum]|uniref:hydroxymethylglutaryl-CoA lyase n=1 Tax=Acetomicrobium flavidum TaxID=49896 RepID=UPI002C13D854|nr:hydroxymethylglutaryl-CoA lyase [Acetomicrobium flavidum]